ncbi:protein NPGR1 [Magnolia sinica]|uniref:protein NPGR1 n=1 Tax=Magnolia sinica TaxID=86752 RepID=UPI0026594081|nr:protein NPGR1 [Magnolia sinica]XP_058081129.1 protein NPGR1 [Magnolia sinica]XP_058081130.1 protein NPGR1 [Magnolia sinica]
MLCACSGERFKFEEAPQSPESLATRDFSASGLSSRTGDWDSKFDDCQVDDVESTLKEALSLNYEEARALLGRLEYQRGNFDAALQVFQGIEIRSLTPRMTKAIAERTRQRKGRYRGESLPAPAMSMHSVSLLLEAMLLKAKSLEELGLAKDAARECKIILDTVESALPNGMPNSIGEDCKMQEMFHRALELLPELWKQAGFLDEAIIAYRRALIKPWNLDAQRLSRIQKDLAALLLYGGVEATFPPQLQVWGTGSPKSNIEEAILLLFILMRKVAFREIAWDSEIMDHLTFALSVSGQFIVLADHIEQVVPGVYTRVERWYLLALCYSAAGRNDAALNILRKVLSHSKTKNKHHLPSLLLGAKLSSQNPKHAHEGVDFARQAIKFIDCRRDPHLIGVAHHLLGVCYGNCARVSISDSERLHFQKESLVVLHHATIIEKDNPEIILSLAVENAVQRNVNAALDNARTYSNMVAGSSARCWKLLAQMMSTEQHFEDAKTVVDIALDETGRKDQLEILRLKALLEVAQEQPKRAIETYRLLLSLVQAQRDQNGNSDHEAEAAKKLEMEAWEDLAKIYTKLGSWPDAKVCLDKAKAIGFHSPNNWHATGMLLEAQSLDNEALEAFSTALSIEPDHVPSMVSTAVILRKFGGSSLPIARSFVMNALRLEPMNHNAWLELGYVSKMEGSLQQAVDCFQAAFELKQSSPVQDFV